MSHPVQDEERKQQQRDRAKWQKGNLDWPNLSGEILDGDPLTSEHQA
jgi:hypothetical protein